MEGAPLRVRTEKARANCVLDNETSGRDGICHASLEPATSRQRTHYMELDHYEQRELAAKYGPLVDVQGFSPQDFEQ